MLHAIVEWMEKEPLKEGGYIDRPRAFKYDDVEDVIVDFEHHKESCRIPMKVLADKDISLIKTHEARKIVRFCKDKLGVK